MIEVLYEDDYCIVVNKPSGLLTHPYKKETNERENLLFSVRDQIDTYLYPIHRLDRPTSGIVIFGKEKEFIRNLQEVWHTDLVNKKYLALVLEKDLKDGAYNFALKSESGIFQEATTEFKVIEHFEESSYIECLIKTGRRHQIRRHFSRRMQHLAGDRKYGKKRHNDYFLEHYGLKRLFLHAHYFSFVHPVTNKNIVIQSKLPKDLQLVLSQCK